MDEIENAGDGQAQTNPPAGTADTAAADVNANQSTVTGDAGAQGEGGEAGGDAGKTGGEGGDGKSSGAPEAYADFTLPEGYALEGERKDDAVALFRDLGLDQAGAQKVIDRFIATQGADDKARAEAYAAQVAQQRDGWGAQLKEKWGSSYDGQLAYAKTAVQAVGSPELVQAFEEHGWGNHPELASAFAFFGKMMRDSPMSGTAAQGSASTAKPWESMYPNM